MTQSTDSTPRFGFVSFAETWNGRLAMMGFVIGLATEVLTGQGILARSASADCPGSRGRRQIHQQSSPVHHLQARQVSTRRVFW